MALAAATLLPLRSALAWSEADFDHRVPAAYTLPAGPENIIGQLSTYTIKKGDTLLDVGRWYDLTPTELSNANHHMDWWAPPVGAEIVLPTEHILPESKRMGIVLNIPEMRLYYFPYSPAKPHKAKGKLSAAAFAPGVVYTFPVGLGRFDWRTPVGSFKVRGKTREPAWVLPDDIYEEHLERDGEAEHMIPGGDPDNPLGHYRLELTLPMYALHGTNIPWGVGMEVSHGCVRLYPEDIEQLFNRVPVGTYGEFVYQPIKYGWRGDSLYVEVHDDLYGRYPGLWKLAVDEAERRGLSGSIDLTKLEKAVEEKSGVPTNITKGPDSDGASY